MFDFALTFLKGNPEMGLFLYIFIPLLLLIGSELVFIKFRPKMHHVFWIRVIQMGVNTALVLSFSFWFLRVFK